MLYRVFWGEGNEIIGEICIFYGLFCGTQYFFDYEINKTEIFFCFRSHFGLIRTKGISKTSFNKMSLH